MRIVISGSSGLIGSALVSALRAEDHEVIVLVRTSNAASGRAATWNPETGFVDADALEGADAVIHLAGENIAQGRWTRARKARILESRVQGTTVLCDALMRLKRRPKTLLCASAVGYYGSRGDDILNEESPPGEGFPADVCKAWEAASLPAAHAGIRVVNLRFGMVLSGQGGALARLLPVFRWGLGGVVGSGKQYMSWIALDDVLGAIRHGLRTDSLEGPVNVAAPQPVTNAVFTRTLARVLRRPALVPAPAFMLRIAFGEMADALLLSSQRVDPAKLRQSGYRFQLEELERTFIHLL